MTNPKYFSACECENRCPLSKKTKCPGYIKRKNSKKEETKKSRREA